MTVTKGMSTCEMLAMNFQWLDAFSIGFKSDIGGALQAHNLKVAGSNPAPATNFIEENQYFGPQLRANLMLHNWNPTIHSDIVLFQWVPIDSGIHLQNFVSIPCHMNGTCPRVNVPDSFTDGNSALVFWLIT